MTIFAIQTADTGKLKAFADAFHRVYRDKGPDASLDPNEVRAVLGLAVEALGQPARDFLSLVDPKNPLRPANPDEVEITCPADAGEEIKAAAALVYCYRHPSRIEPSELDDAYSALAGADVEHSPSP
ncbi:hypothetical protein HFO56_33940 [Rhizobium laguerreae]|uniref:hypothetical protein n=1 Tax=Rhizobium laguerreae TaxID=1076926 RepID=UPI001C926AA5|nr:hypothetical protein [Rhizobium laguerreae]MBY3157329.1 hypothetical protein [Rhizobium laguerreae]